MLDALAQRLERIVQLDVGEGDFKHMGRSEVETATLALADGTHIRVPYETGYASMAPLYYERFWIIKHPVLEKFE